MVDHKILMLTWKSSETETVNNYPCTHLQHGGGTNEVSDYWMSPNVPGFSKLVNTLKTISPNLPALAFSGTVFNWGGLVKWTVSDVVQGRDYEYGATSSGSQHGHNFVIKNV